MSGEVGDRLVEDVALAEVRGDRDRSPERAWARASVLPHSSRVGRRGRGASPRPSPSPSSPTAGARSSHAHAVNALRRGQPAEQDVARRLHQALPLDHAPALVAYSLAPGYGSSTEGWASLTWRKSGSLLVAPEQEHDPGARADAADAHDLAGQVDVAVAVEQPPAVALERAAVGARRADAGLDRPAGPSRDEILDGTMSGGSATMRGWPSTRWHRLDPGRACCPCVRALATLFSNALASLLAAWAPSSRSIIPTSARAYQTSRSRMPANSRIARRYAPTASGAAAPLGIRRPRARPRGEAGGEALDVPLPRAREASRRSR